MTINVEEVLRSKLVMMFPDNGARAEVVRLLNQYGRESYENEVGRVHLGILKVAGTSIEAVKMWVDVAKKDYRDVLAAAECPNELVAPTWKMEKDESTKIRDKDRKQYEEWINRR